MLCWLDEGVINPFPPLKSALKEPDGLLAAGGDLSPERLLLAYQNGIFPWYSEDQPILWWSPDPRSVLLPAEFKRSRSLKKSIHNRNYSITADTQFNEVIQQCSAIRAQSGTWIMPEMIDGYRKLHDLGFAHSIEVSCEGKLVGGLYGIALGSVFFGESMFSLATDASKVALYFLCRQLLAWNFTLIDCQIASSHLDSLGAKSISRESFQSHLPKDQELDEFAGTWQWVFQ